MELLLIVGAFGIVIALFLFAVDIVNSITEDFSEIVTKNADLDEKLNLQQDNQAIESLVINSNEPDITL